MTTFTNIVCKSVLILALVSLALQLLIGAADAASPMAMWFWILGALACAVTVLTVIRSEVIWR